MRRMIVVAGIIGAPIAAQAAEWTRFSNDRYGFSVDIPATFKALPPPENDDGRMFTSPDGRSKISAYGHLFVDVRGMIEDERQQEGFEAADHLTVTYRHVSAETYTYSGIKGDRIVYVHAVKTCKDLAAAIVNAEYPVADKARFDPIVAHMAKTLRGSNACWVPG